MWELGRLLGDKCCSWLFLSQSWVIFHHILFGDTLV